MPALHVTSAALCVPVRDFSEFTKFSPRSVLCISQIRNPTRVLLSTVVLVPSRACALEHEAHILSSQMFRYYVPWAAKSLRPGLAHRKEGNHPPDA